jgi:UDPglucose--hexose-1-phosphate uridylyltransferase
VAGEFRFDGLTREWVNIVGERQSRPNRPLDDCPFCVGGLEAPDDYDVRWFENRWPALTPGASIDLDAATASGITQLPAIGAAEVILYSPNHGASVSTLSVPEMRKVVDLWAERTESLLARDEIEYVLVFETRGRDVGATIDHPHGQIYAYPFVPPAPAAEAAVARDHGCQLCAEVAAEIGHGERIVYTSDTWIAYVPFASAYPYGMRVVPRDHVPGFPSLTEGQRDGLSLVLPEVLARYDHLWGSPDERVPQFGYCSWFHQAPKHDDGEYHLHAHLAPPQRAPGVARYIASGELGSGTLSNPVVPEAAAAALRRAAS